MSRPNPPRYPARKTKPARTSRRDFWGDDLPRTDRFEDIPISGDPTALIRSLGDPPLAGHDTVAQHYFAAVYDKAAGLARALVAAQAIESGAADDE